MSQNFISLKLDDRSLGNTLLALDRFGKKAEKIVKDVVNKTALAIETDAKNKLKTDGHIITGRLRASIHAEVKPNEGFSYDDTEGNTFDGALKTPFGDLDAIAGTNVEYAARIEYGFNGTDKLGRKYNQIGSSYMRWASENQKEKFVTRMKNALNKLIGEQQS